MKYPGFMFFVSAQALTCAVELLVLTLTVWRQRSPLHKIDPARAVGTVAALAGSTPSPIVPADIAEATKSAVRLRIGMQPHFKNRRCLVNSHHIFHVRQVRPLYGSKLCAGRFPQSRGLSPPHDSGSWLEGSSRATQQLWPTRPPVAPAGELVRVVPAPGGHHRHHEDAALTRQVEVSAFGSAGKQGRRIAQLFVMCLVIACSPASSATTSPPPSATVTEV